MATKKRGANGGGSIRQREDGTWEARITLGTNPGTGKPVRKSIYGKTQKEVRQKMQKALVEVDEGTFTQQSKITVKQWLETWLAEYTGDVKDSTRTSYRQHMNNHIIPALGAVKLSALTPAACQKFINDLTRVSVAVFFFRLPIIQPKNVNCVNRCSTPKFTPNTTTQANTGTAEKAEKPGSYGEVNTEQHIAKRCRANSSPVDRTEWSPETRSFRTL